LKVRVKVVGPLAQFYPAGEGEVELPEGARAAQLIDVLGLPRFPPPVVVVNGRQAREGTVLQPGDEVSLLWPAGGG